MYNIVFNNRYFGLVSEHLFGKVLIRSDMITAQARFIHDLFSSASLAQSSGYIAIPIYLPTLPTVLNELTTLVPFNLSPYMYLYNANMHFLSMFYP